MEFPQLAHMVKRRRETLRLSMRAAAQAGELSPTTWSELEQGKRMPSASTQRAVAVALQWPVSWLEYLDSGDEPPEVSQPDGDVQRRVEQLEQDVLDLAVLVRHLLRDEIAELSESGQPDSVAGALRALG